MDQRLLRTLGVIIPALLCCGSAGVSSPAHRPAAAPSRAAPRERAYYLYSLAQQAQFERNYVDALKYLQEAVRADDSPDLRFELADLYSSLNQIGEAEQQARAVLAKDAGNAAARKLLAQILAGGPATEADHGSRVQEAESLFRGLLDEGKADDDSAMALADLQMERGSAAEARATLETYRSSHPGSSAVDMELARIYRLEGRSENAIALLQGVLEREKDNREARNALGGSLEEAGRYEEAAAAYQVLVDQSPTNPYGHYRLALVQLSLKKYREAQDHLTLALKADPANVRVLLALGQAYEGSHESQLAEGAYQRAMSRDPASIEARFFMARLHQSRGEDQEALTLYSEILAKSDARSTPEEKTYYSVAATQVGMIRLLEKDFPAALASLEEAFAASEKPASGVYGLLVRTYIEKGEPEKAQRILAEARENYPEDPELFAQEGEILLRSSHPDEARASFRKLLTASKESEESYLEVIQACLRAETLREAEPWMREALQKHPESSELQFQGAALNERLGRFKQSEREFRELIRKEPDDAEALNYLGYMLADRGVKLEDALSMLERAVSLDSDNVAFLDSLGWVHYRLGRYEKAEEYLDRAARGSRADPTILDHLGDARAARGKKSEAAEAYRTALQHAPEDPQAIRKKIQKLGFDPGPR